MPNPILEQVPNEQLENGNPSCVKTLFLFLMVSN